MGGILAALADPTIHDLYMAACFIVMVVPMIALAWWYHANIGRTEGGRALMRRQHDVGVSHRPADAGRMLSEARKMGADIAAGRYGAHSRRMQNRVYAVTGLWLAVLAAMFGILFWADAVNRTGG
jgi:hypothetical protein